MEFKHLTAFVAVVRRNSFSKAAEDLFLSQPTVSTYIRQLEEELNTVLLVRTTKSLEITPKGREVYEYAASILALRDKIVENCSGQEDCNVRIGASTVPSAYLLPDVLAAYTKQEPHIRFTVDQGDSRMILERLKDGLYDLGIIGMDPKDRQLTADAFYRDTIVIVTPREPRFLKLQEQDETPLEELLKEPVIVREEGSASKYAVDLFLKQAGVQEAALNVTARINDPEAIKNMVARGIGTAIMSILAAENYRDQKQVLVFPFPGEGCHRNFYLLRRKEGIMTEQARNFAEFLLKFYRN